METDNIGITQTPVEENRVAVKAGRDQRKNGVDPKVTLVSRMKSAAGKHLSPKGVGNALKRLWAYDRLLFLFAFIPTAGAILYYGLIASDVYVSESQFVVRSSQTKASFGGLGMLLGANFSSSQLDSHSVSTYMQSRDAVKHLNDNLKMQDMFDRWDVDPFNRYGGLKWWQNNHEAFFRYYQKHVSIHVNNETSISTLTTRAFDPNQAYLINDTLLNLGEALVNKLNERARQDMIRFAEAEVKEAERRARAATEAIVSYQKRSSVFDPAEHEKLMVEKLNSIKQLEVRNAAVVQAIDDARRQVLYLERIVQPNTPDSASEPHRIQGIVEVLVLGLIVWGIMSLLLAGVREHYD